MTTGGYLGSVGRSAIGRAVRLGVLRLPPRALLSTSVSGSLNVPSGLGLSSTGILVLDLDGGLTGREDAAVLSMGLSTGVRSGTPAARVLALPRSALSKSAAEGGGCDGGGGIADAGAAPFGVDDLGGRCGGGPKV